MGEVFLPGRRLNEFPDAGKEVKIFQVIPGEFPGQKEGPFGERLIFVDEDQGPVQDLAPAAVDGELFVCKTFVAHVDLQPGGKALQLLKKERI
jgi:hypothetical protein